MNLELFNHFILLVVVDRNIEQYGIGRFGPNYTSKYAVKYRQVVRMKKQHTTLTNRVWIGNIYIYNVCINLLNFLIK